jgi:zinc transport system ATP-binding protein
MLITHNINESNANYTHVLSLHNGEAVFRQVPGGDE